MTVSLKKNREWLDSRLKAGKSFDMIRREIRIGGREACLYFIDGFCKDELMQKLLEHFMEIQEKDMPADAAEMAEGFVPYVEVEVKAQWEEILYGILSGVSALFVDGYADCILIDSRTYPARGVEEPEKDKVLRGSKDGFVETIVFNTALIRRRIRSTDLVMEMMHAGKSSRTDIVLCYMDSRVDRAFLEKIRDRIKHIRVDALTMNQESLAECLYARKWYNPFPKFKFTERPDTAAAQVLEGNIVILVDNSPSVLILPTSVFDVVEEADDFYFPPITGTYLRLSRLLIALLTYFLTPTFLLLMQYPQWIPAGFSFILIKDGVNIPLVWQFLILELAIDGLRLAAVNTPSMLSTPLSVMAALVLGEFAVNSGWFNSEVMLYMAFVALASYTQSSYELGYALKFMRIANLILTAALGVWGYAAGLLLCSFSLLANKTISGQSYLYPLIPFDGKQLRNRFLRTRLPGSLEPAEEKTGEKRS
ncbi:MAG TPA: spore germination protein [Candidatus Eisenbergiella merdipullorum]|uniref:Spore germination protein n=1 Tax=Candidatus Eisenbergiella merdipullorum TaxID=2838553 RepID=A0A9D2L0U9_9FIRM|nr:spore germination protein [Candidatus Eisenbergiella merdipullorum]